MQRIEDQNIKFRGLKVLKSDKHSLHLISVFCKQTKQSAGNELKPEAWHNFERLGTGKEQIQLMTKDDKGSSISPSGLNFSKHGSKKNLCQNVC